MKKFFPSDVLLGRNGGDEFCVLIPNCTYEEAKEKLTQFTKTPKTFLCKGEEHSFYISLGYAEYPRSGSNHSQLMRCADAALYEIKLHGKMDVWHIGKDFNQESVNNWDLRLKMFQNIFRVHLLFIKRIKR